MMIQALLLLAAVRPLHFTVTYETAEVRAGSDVLARILCTSASGIDVTVMTDAQRQYREDVIRRIDSNWAGETRRGRLRLVLALSKADGAAPSAGVTHDGCRFLFPDETVVRADFLLSNPTGSEAVVVEDLESGQYLAVEKVGKPSDLPELFVRLLANNGPEEKDPAVKEELERRIREESESTAAKTRAVAEVNGQRDLLPSGATNDEIGRALARMWDNLDGEPRRRIERVLGILAVVRAAMKEPPGDVETFSTGAYVPASALGFKAVPAIQPPAGAHLVRTSSFRNGVMNLQPPPEEVTKPFYAKRGWWAVDFSGSFPGQVERLLRGDRP
jgi:hypothetical protein